MAACRIARRSGKRRATVVGRMQLGAASLPSSSQRCQRGRSTSESGRDAARKRGQDVTQSGRKAHVFQQRVSTDFVALTW